MDYLKSNDRPKRKRNENFVHLETRDEVSSRVVRQRWEFGDESSFLEFRNSTIHFYPSLNWLGPGVMAVHWFKEYLKKNPFGWVQRSKRNPVSLPSSTSAKGERERRNDVKRRKLANHSKGNFYFIPGQYLPNTEETNESKTEAKELAIQNVLDFGTPGVHYATSYIGVYNLLRKYGKFAALDNSKDVSSINCHQVSEQKPSIVPVLYKGPPLHK